METERALFGAEESVVEFREAIERFFRRGFGRGLGFRRFWGEPFEGDYVPMTPETEREILEQEKQYLTQRLAYIQERLGKE